MQDVAASSGTVSARAQRARCLPVFCVFGFTHMHTGSDGLPCKTVLVVTGEVCLHESGGINEVKR